MKALLEFFSHKSLLHFHLAPLLVLLDLGIWYGVWPSLPIGGTSDGREPWDVSSPHYFIWTYPLNGYTYVSSRTGVWIAFIAQVSW